MSDFVFRIDAFQLNPAQQQKVAAAMRTAAMTQLAELDLSAANAGTFVFAPHKWNGGWVHGLTDAAKVASTTLTVSAASTAAKG